MKSDSTALFTVRAERERFAASFRCSTPDEALRQFRYFIGRNYERVTITDAAGEHLTEDDLLRLSEQEAAPERGAPVNIEAPNALAA